MIEGPRNCRHMVRKTLTAVVAMVVGGTTADAQNFGKPGEPVELVVGHPCCYTEVWSVIARQGILEKISAGGFFHQI